MLQMHSTWVVFAPSLFHAETLQFGSSPLNWAEVRTYTLTKKYLNAEIYSKWSVQAYTRMCAMQSC